MIVQRSRCAVRITMIYPVGLSTVVRMGKDRKKRYAFKGNYASDGTLFLTTCCIRIEAPIAELSFYCRAYVEYPMLPIILAVGQW